MFCVLIIDSLTHPRKVVIAGNHDLTFDEQFCTDPENLLRFGVKMEAEKAALAEINKTSAVDILENCTYLFDSQVTICGVKIHGSPW